MSLAVTVRDGNKEKQLSKQVPKICAILFHPFDPGTMSVPTPVVLAQHDQRDFTEFVNTCVGNFPPVNDWQFGHFRVLFGKSDEEAILARDHKKSVGLLGVSPANLRQFVVKKAGPLFQ